MNRYGITAETSDQKINFRNQIAMTENEIDEFKNSEFSYQIHLYLKLEFREALAFMKSHSDIANLLFVSYEYFKKTNLKHKNFINIDLMSEFLLKEIENFKFKFNHYIDKDFIDVARQEYVK